MIDALGVSTSYTYDQSGNKLSMTDGRGMATVYRYSSFGRLIGSTDADNQTESYYYDLNSNMTKKLDKNGNTTLFTYGHRNLLTRSEVIVRDETEASADSIIAFTYGAAGRRETMTDVSGSYAYSYDNKNRLTQIKLNGGPQIAYTYDELGNILTVTDAKNNVTAYSYDNVSRLKTVSSGGIETTYNYDNNGNLASTSTGTLTAEYEYNDNNKVTKVTNQRGGAVISQYAYTYDNNNRQTSKDNGISVAAYEYDAAGRVEKVIMSGRQGLSGKTTLYSYDNAGNRISMVETHTDKKSSGYVDKATGNMVEYTIKRSQYVYSGSNKLLQITEDMNDASDVLQVQKIIVNNYDNNGNQIAQMSAFESAAAAGSDDSSVSADVNAETVTGGALEYVTNEYNEYNMLKRSEAVKGGESIITEFAYNGDGLRTKRTVTQNGAAKVTNYAYHGQNVILETDADNNATARYVRGLSYIAKIGASNNVSYYQYNAHGDVVQTVDAGGNVINQYDYDIFGNEILNVTNEANDVRYAGEILDETTGLYYLRARYYDAYSGRFTTEDTFKGYADDPLSLNLYSYCKNDPIQFIDPSGHEPENNYWEEVAKNGDIYSMYGYVYDDKKGSFVKSSSGGSVVIPSDSPYYRPPATDGTSGNKGETGADGKEPDGSGGPGIVIDKNKPIDDKYMTYVKDKDGKRIPVYFNLLRSESGDYYISATDAAAILGGELEVIDGVDLNGNKNGNKIAVGIKNIPNSKNIKLQTTWDGGKIESRLSVTADKKTNTTTIELPEAKNWWTINHGMVNATELFGDLALPSDQAPLQMLLTGRITGSDYNEVMTSERPTTVIQTETDVFIFSKIKFSDNIVNGVVNKNKMKEKAAFVDDGKLEETYADLVKEGIEEGWNGEFEGRTVSVVLMDAEGMDIPEHSYIDFKFVTGNKSMAIRTGISMLHESSKEKFKWVAAHEFGHCLGLSDAYPQRYMTSSSLITNSNIAPTLMANPLDNTVAKGKAQPMDYDLLLSFEPWPWETGFLSFNDTILEDRKGRTVRAIVKEHFKGVDYSDED